MLHRANLEKTLSIPFKPAVDNHIINTDLFKFLRIRIIRIMEITHVIHIDYVASYYLSPARKWRTNETTEKR